MRTDPSLERRLELSRAINQVSEAILRDDTTSGILQSLVDIAGPAMHVDRALIYDVQLSAEIAVALSEWLHPDRDIIPTKAVYPLQPFREAGLQIIRTCEPLESSIDAVHPALAADGADQLLHNQMAIQRLLWHPLRMRPDGFYLLVFNQVTENRPWTVDELDFIRVVAGQVSLAVMKLELLRELEESQAKLARDLEDAKQLQQLSSQLIEDESGAAIYDQILDAAMAIMRSDFASIQVLDAEHYDLRLLAWRNFHPESAAYWAHVSVHTGTACGSALKHGERKIMPDVTADPAAPSETLRHYRLSGITAQQSTPLTTREGRVVGMISTHWRERHEPGERELALFDVLAREAADVLERRRAQEALRTSEQKFRALFESIDEGFAIIEMIRDEAGKPVDVRYLEANRAYERLSGAPNPTGQLMSQVRANTEPYWLEAYDDVARTGLPLRMENYHAGTERWYRVYASRMGGKDSRQVAVVFDEITERKRAEADQQLLSDLTKELVSLDHIADAMKRFGERIGRHLGVKWCIFAELSDDLEQSAITHGWNAPEVPSLNGVYRIRDYASEEELARYRTGELSIVSDTQNDARVNADNYGALGIRSFIVAPLVRDNACRFLISVIHDSPRIWRESEIALVREIADRIWMRLERARADEALRESEARYRLVYDNTPAMFFSVDPEGIVRGVNRVAIESLGYSEEELIGHDVMLVVHPQDRAEVAGRLAACFADASGKHTFSFRKVRKDGSTIWVKEATRVVEGPNGASAFILCEDITEARVFEEAARRAELQSHHKDEFMAMLGHELRNPLSPIVSALETMRRTGRDDPEISVIERQVFHLRRLVDDLLDVSRITQGAVELHRERIELAVVAAQAIELARPLFERKQQIAVVDIDSLGLAINADSSRLVQALANLLTNASKYSQTGEQVFFHAERQGDRIVIQIRDQGEGIEPEMLERVFDLFVQRPQSSDRAQSGLGLGLTIARNLITLHGGTVRAHSEGTGRGTTIFIELPAAEVEAVAQSSPPPRAVMDLASHGEAVESVLVVDDNDDGRKALCRLLALLGYRVHAAADGLAALTIARETKPQVVLVDIGLPGMDGYELARVLRREYSGDMRLVAVTGYGQESDRARALAAGFDAHLVKPVEIDTLLPHLMAHV